MRLTIFLVIVLAILIGIGFVFKFNVALKNQITAIQTPINKVEELGAGSALPGFPKAEDLSLPSSAVIIKNYRATSPQGQVQLTKVLTSSKSVEEIFSFFLKNLSEKSSGWSVLAQDKADKNRQAIFARNSTGILNISITSDSNSQKTIVDLSFLLNK